MTNREFYLSVISANISDEMTAKATELVASLDSRNEKRKSADSKAKREVADRKSAVLAFLRANDGAHSRTEIATACGITEGQATSACTSLVALGVVEKSTIKVDKASKVVYSATAEAEE